MSPFGRQTGKDPSARYSPTYTYGVGTSATSHAAQPQVGSSTADDVLSLARYLDRDRLSHYTDVRGPTDVPLGPPPFPTGPGVTLGDLPTPTEYANWYLRAYTAAERSLEPPTLRTGRAQFGPAVAVGETETEPWKTKTEMAINIGLIRLGIGVLVGLALFVAVVLSIANTL